MLVAGSALGPRLIQMAGHVFMASTSPIAQNAHSTGTFNAQGTGAWRPDNLVIFPSRLVEITLATLFGNVGKACSAYSHRLAKGSGAPGATQNGSRQVLGDKKNRVRTRVRSTTARYHNVLLVVSLLNTAD